MGNETEDSNSNSWLPRMPRFRKPDGSVEWRQVGDMFIPGNVFDSQTSQWRPQGMVAGVAGSLVPGGGVLTEALYANRNNIRMPNFSGVSNPLSGLGSWLAGRTGRVREDRGFLGPTARPTAERPTVPNFAGVDNWGTAQQPAPTVDPNYRMPGVSDYRSRTPGSAANTVSGAWQRRGFNQNADDSLAWAGSPGAMSENMIETRFGLRPLLREK